MLQFPVAVSPDNPFQQNHLEFSITETRNALANFAALNSIELHVPASFNASDLIEKITWENNCNELEFE